MWRSIPKYLINNIIFRNRVERLPAGQNSLCRPKQEVSLQSYRHHIPTAFKISMPISVIEKVEAFDKQRCITVHWDDGNHSQYPYVWLRDNCQCPQCFLSSAKARKLPIEDLDVNISVEKVISTDSKISVVWPDQHISEFDSNWLKTRSFAQTTRKEIQQKLFLTDQQNWGSELQIPTASFEEVLDNDEVAYQWLKTLRKIGVMLLKNAPAEKGQVAKLGERIGYLRLTFYGLTWQVEDKADANNVAYTSGKLSLHTDYPALHRSPGIQLLHCIKPAEIGGETQIVDGFHVANQLRQLNPEAFRILTSILVDFTDSGVDYCDFSLQSKHRIIDLDHNGKVIQINFNNATRDSIFDVPVELVHPFFSALKDYINLMYKPENLITFKMEAGDVLTFDNWRILHGRQNYISTVGSSRHLEGAYASWDEAMSRLRCLEQALYGNK
ncbi:gamma-butyrobetaine dioxygenase [Hemiscyllium ocellatum]|uniref:gamma-butyrobetaine dioxygenase n=1 Tax=Hemiscyllium ocellatum TaxID=170820 RepID=UPI0029661B8C|nr:gamma-butyrobetaine dioxygenase [Hemiscyllium ocellatum]XP_060695076.1 gamma-butyrobetaine dioxygenase [Hemiscyllium ocellatum]